MSQLSPIASMRLFALITLALCLSGCATSMQPVTGFAYSHVSGPLQATSADRTADKMGRATAVSYLGLVATGHASINRAMENGGITELHHVDYRSNSILGIYAEFTVIAYGN